MSPFPFLLDCATSITQRGKVELYAREGKDLPKGWVIDRNGESKTNSSKVLEDLISGNAALTPLGGVGEETGDIRVMVMPLWSRFSQQRCSRALS